MNKYYNLYRKQLNSENQKALLSSQKNWIEYRNTEFELIDFHYLDEIEGTMWRQVAVTEKANLVKNRALMLKNYYDQLVEFKTATE